MDTNDSPPLNNAVAPHASSTSSATPPSTRSESGISLDQQQSSLTRTTSSTTDGQPPASGGESPAVVDETAAAAVRRAILEQYRDSTIESSEKHKRVRILMQSGIAGLTNYINSLPLPPSGCLGSVDSVGSVDSADEIRHQQADVDMSGNNCSSATQSRSTSTASRGLSRSKSGSTNTAQAPAPAPPPRIPSYWTPDAALYPHFVIGGGQTSTEESSGNTTAAAAVAGAGEQQLPSIFGCTHYKRDVYILMPCCNRWYPCQRCHNESEDHRVVLADIQTQCCMYCFVPTPVGRTCTSEQCNGRSVCAYYCDKCRIHRKEADKPFWHCDECGMCRAGVAGHEYKHCSRCNLCIDTAYDHTCLLNASESECPVCKESIHSSLRHILILVNCGHMIHHHCLLNLFQANEYRCPVCKKAAISDMAAQWEQMDIMCAINEMPEPSCHWKARIGCNDCERPSESVPYHWVGMKCEHCGGYNTYLIDVVKPDGTPVSPSPGTPYVVAGAADGSGPITATTTTTTTTATTTTTLPSPMIMRTAAAAFIATTTTTPPADRTASPPFLPLPE